MAGGDRSRLWRAQPFVQLCSFGRTGGSPEPLLRSKIFRVSEFSAATAGETVYYLCLHAIGFLMPLYLTRGRGFTAAQIGIFMASQSAARAIAAPLSGRMSDLFGVRVLTCGGILFLMAAVCCMYSFGADTPAVGISAALVLLGTAPGCLPQRIARLFSAPPRRSSMAYRRAFSRLRVMWA